MPGQELVDLFTPYLNRSASVEEARRKAISDGHSIPQPGTLRMHYRSVGSNMSAHLKRQECVTVGTETTQGGTSDALLLNAIRRTETFEELCDELNLAPRVVRGMLEDAQQRGLAVSVAGEAVSLAPERPREEQQHVAFPTATRSLKFAVITDQHAGSRYARADALGDFVRKAYDAGCRHVLHAGDVLDGSAHMHRGILYEQDAHGLHAQCDAAIDALPEIDGLEYAFICGNHDISLFKTDGANVGRTLLAVAAERGRSDLQYLGQDRARILLGGTGIDGDGLAVDLLHPGGGGGGKNMSLKLRNLIDGYASGNKPQIMLLGHHHQYCHISFRRIHAFACPAFQDQTPFMRSKAIHPSVGGIIIEVDCAEDWSITALTHTVVEYAGRGYEAVS